MKENNSATHGGNLYAAIRDQGGSLSEILDFSANINPLGLSDKIREALHASLEAVIHYPDAQAHAVKQGVSQYYQVAENRITMGNGAVELMYILCHILKPTQVLVTAPTFSEYEAAAKSSGATIHYLYLSPENEFSIPIPELVEKIKGMDIIFICNPNNPTGALLTNTQIEVVLQVAQQQDTYVVVDESFIDFLPNDQTYTCRQLLLKYPKLIIFHSLTKFYAIPGLRLGFSLTNPQLATRLHLGKDPWNVNTLAQSAGVAALQDATYQKQSKEFLEKVKIDLYESLQTIPGLHPYKPSVNFILIHIKETGMTSTELMNAMAQHNILVRDCSNYPGLSSEYIRVAVKSPSQNAQLLTTLKKVIGDKK
jgi:threonine-phosphate decarboxylase